MGTPSEAAPGAQAEDMAVATHLQLGFLETTKALEGERGSHDCLK